MAGQTGFPLLVSCRRGGAQVQIHSSSARAQPEEQKTIHDGGGVAGAQVEAALNRKNVEVLPEETVDALEGGPEDAWVPDQETGVFFPADEAVSGTENLNHGAPVAGGSSVLDQAVFVREEDMEDVERPAVDMASANHKAK
ncbi:hypothetical protein E2562_016287 [Oryza meyeriana var. granulata]|uniref:Uncharacterized protein n=1 Tax=Oryza meyeriana var. granulata TaxID=110450 RepID=A0A6G1CS95_9ORYZ|nr:hypothetical protein E2562_016287 [Oryza meyeriana var. granulata]